MNDSTGGEPAIGVSYSVQVGDGRNLVFQSHVPQSYTAEELNLFVDKLREVADRNVAFGKLEARDHEIEVKKGIARNAKMNLQMLDAKAQTLQSVSADQTRRYPKGQRDADDQSRKNAVAQMKYEEESLAELVKMRDEFRASLG